MGKPNLELIIQIYPHQKTKWRRRTIRGSRCLNSNYITLSCRRLTPRLTSMTSSQKTHRSETTSVLHLPPTPPIAHIRTITHLLFPLSLLHPFVSCILITFSNLLSRLSSQKMWRWRWRKPIKRLSLLPRPLTWSIYRRRWKRAKSWDCGVPTRARLGAMEQCCVWERESECVYVEKERERES